MFCLYLTTMLDRGILAHYLTLKSLWDRKLPPRQSHLKPDFFRKIQLYLSGCWRNQKAHGLYFAWKRRLINFALKELTP